MTKRELIKILEERQYYFEKNKCNKFEAHEMEVAIRIIQRLVPPDYFDNEPSDGCIHDFRSLGEPNMSDVQCIKCGLIKD